MSQQPVPKNEESDTREDLPAANVHQQARAGGMKEQLEEGGEADRSGEDAHRERDALRATMRGFVPEGGK